MSAPGPATLRAPLEMPADRARSILAGWEAPAFLDGGAGLGPEGRWSFLAARPRRTIESATGLGYRVEGGPVAVAGGGDAIVALAALAQAHRLGEAGPSAPADPDEPPFRGGLIGHLGYDLAPLLERVPRRRPVDSAIPALRFGLHDRFIAIDHDRDRAEIWAVDLLGEGPTALRDGLDRWRRDLDRGEPRPIARPSIAPPAPDGPREAHEARVRRALEYIRAGDIFQANLSHRFAAIGAIDPFGLSRALRSISPAPYAAVLAPGPWAIVSASPELYLDIDGDLARTRPIKGTRPRSARPEEDARLAAELRDSPKDRAELTMIVDLERNDLGRACRFGTVCVVDPGRVESFAQVHHLVATIEGRLRAGIGAVGAIRATFPGGSITGAPKIRAMQIIDELESNRRAAYTGAIGYLGVGGRSAFNIAIRTIQVEPGRATYQVGGGIVVDSDPALEYEETLHKGRGLCRALLLAGGGG